MITPEFKKKVLATLLEDREMYPDLSDARYAQKINVNASVFSQLKNGKTEKLASVDFWVDQAYRLNVSTNKKQWNVARTAVYVEIEEQKTNQNKKSRKKS